MSTIHLKELEILKTAKKIKLINSFISGPDGRRYSEPFYDLDDEGNPCDYDFDVDVPDPTLDQITGFHGDPGLVGVRPSEFAETAIRIPEAGRVTDFTFEGREYLRRIYDSSSKKVLLKCGRQVEKSTTVANKLICYAALMNHFRALYVAPSADQAKVFSNDRVRDVIENSPLLKAYTPGALNQNVFRKKFVNFSQITLRYAYLTADRVRGISADMITIDEIQDILIENIPVIEQCAFHSPVKQFLYSGTPKSLDNTIEHYWQEFSTQNEWTVPCERHGTPKDPGSWHWNVLDISNIGKKCLICDKCGGAIDPQHPHAQWTSLNPVDKNNAEKVTFDGYRVPQIMVPWVDWQEVVEALEQYPRPKFMNEKLGMSYDSGVKPITRAQLKACCRPELRISDIDSIKSIIGGRPVYCGIDWGTGENASYTMISFGAYIGTGNFTIFYIHRFTGHDLEPDRQLDAIRQMVSQMNTRIVGTDYGGGFYQNDKLIRTFGPKRVFKYNYNWRQKKLIYWEPNLKRFMVHRTEVMNAIFTAMKDRKIDLPCWDDFHEPFGSDILSIFTEYNEQLRMDQFKKSPGKTDDAFHSILLCVLASMIEHERPDILIPGKETGISIKHG